MASVAYSSVVALHGFVVRMQSRAEYELLPIHEKTKKPFFQFRCEAMGEEVFGCGRSKSDAKQAVARTMLEHLSVRGYRVPEEFRSPDAERLLTGHYGLPTNSFVALVSEICDEHNYHYPQYEVEVDVNRKHTFTVTARMDTYQWIGSGCSQKMATQLAAEQIYLYLRTRLAGSKYFKIHMVDLAASIAFERAIGPPPLEEAGGQGPAEEETEAGPSGAGAVAAADVVPAPAAPDAQAAAAEAPVRRNNIRKKRKRVIAVEAAYAAAAEAAAAAAAAAAPPALQLLQGQPQEERYDSPPPEQLAQAMERLGM